jgi:hypothetical protein
MSNRHPGVAAALRWFTFEHLPVGTGRRVSSWFADLANLLTTEIEATGRSDVELTYALRELLAAKDAAVRAALVAEGKVT